MDTYLRDLLRKAQVSGDIEAETQYLVSLQRAGKIDDKRLELASYLGYPATQELAPYTTPFDIARLMHSPEPSLPKTSWFCESFERPFDDANDIAHLWTDNLSFEYGTDVAMAALGLCLKFICNVTTTNIDPLFPILSNAYHQVATALILMEITPDQGHPGNSASLTQALQALPEISSIDDERLYNAFHYTNLSIKEAQNENKEPMSTDWHYTTKEAFKEAIDYANNQHAATELCAYVSRHLPPYILGYQSLAEIL